MTAEDEAGEQRGFSQVLTDVLSDDYKAATNVDLPFALITEGPAQIQPDVGMYTEVAEFNVTVYGRQMKPNMQQSERFMFTRRLARAVQTQLYALENIGLNGTVDNLNINEVPPPGVTTVGATEWAAAIVPVEVTLVKGYD